MELWFKVDSIALQVIVAALIAWSLAVLFYNVTPKRENNDDSKLASGND